MPITTNASSANFNRLVGMLFHLYPKKFPLLTKLGITNFGINPNANVFEKVGNYEFQDRRFTRRPGTQANAAVEGATAPSPSITNETPINNVVQLFHDTFGATYLAQSLVNRTTGNLDDSNADVITGIEPAIQDILGSELEQVILNNFADLNFSALWGTYTKPADPTSAALKMGGILNHADNQEVTAGGSALTKTMIDQLTVKLGKVGAFAASKNNMLQMHAGAFQLSKLNDIYGNAVKDITIGGTTLKTLYTSGGTYELIDDNTFDVDGKAATLGVINADECKLVYLPFMGKIFHVEELSKTSSAVRYQFYGQLGIKRGEPKHHGKITGLAIA